MVVARRVGHSGHVTDLHLVAFVVLRRADEILLARRSGVSYADGSWGLPGGHVDPGEPLAVGAARETREEVGVEVAVADLVPVGMCRYEQGGAAGIDVFFTASTFVGEPRAVSECDAVRWCRADDLPDPVVPWLPATLRRHLDEGAWFDEMLDAGPLSPG